VSLVSLPADSVKQRLTDGAVRNLAIRARIEDQGGNVSANSTNYLVNLDTNIASVIVDTTAGAGAGVTPAQAANPAGIAFQGTGVEHSANVLITLVSSTTGNLLRLSTSALADGSFKVQLTPSDLQTLGEGATSYSVIQTDLAGNKSTATAGSFNIALTVGPPVILDIAGDNIIGVTELGAPLAVTGLGVKTAVVALTYFIRNADGSYPTTPAITKSNIVVDDAGKWTSTLTVAEMSMLAAANPNQASTVIVRATQTTGGATSADTSLAFTVDSNAPQLAAVTPIQLFDANGDGANNDGIWLSFSEPVRGTDLKNLVLGQTYTLPATKTFGTNARAELTGLTIINGAEFATGVKIF
jgi:hypothetical protein